MSTLSVHRHGSISWSYGRVRRIVCVCARVRISREPIYVLRSTLREWRVSIYASSHPACTRITLDMLINVYDKPEFVLEITFHVSKLDDRTLKVATGRRVTTSGSAVGCRAHAREHSHAHTRARETSPIDACGRVHTRTRDRPDRSPDRYRLCVPSKWPCIGDAEPYVWGRGFRRPAVLRYFRAASTAAR
ncbi:hypothetical protein EVAR_51752_1 [Eumeta japonica]|uniref:Uncharacterized protein n=1 Tax=Eumeta variegata TaxID=151549 RepID=A0A4C1XFF2_EUMVA|nr:hypothetical protein EVAR_51752_1 [Eumeta japonica]